METATCNQCGGSDAREVFPATLGEGGGPRGDGAFRCTSAGYGAHFRIVECRRCGLAYANPRYTAEEILQAYQNVQDPLYLQERAGRELTFRKHLADFERVAGRGTGRRLLDVGAYIGVFVQIARENGWDAEGLEPSRWAVELAQSQGLPVRAGTLATAPYPAGHFDALTLWDVIEHMADPLAELRRAARLLKPGGALAVHTMDLASPFARLMGARWPWLMEMHLYFFSRRTLRVLLESAGFEVLSIRPQGRYLRLGYLITRIQPYSRPLAALLDWLADRLRLRQLPIPLNFGDLVTAYARKVDVEREA